MDILTGIANFLVNEILSKPAYLVGLMTAIGLIALRKSWGAVFGGFIKATLGFLILGAGAGVVIAAMTPLGTSILGVTNAQGVVPTNEAIVALAQKDYGALTAWVMSIGFLLSLVLARVTRLRYVFLTGHHTFYMATMLTVILVVGKLEGIWVVFGGALLLATIMVVMPAFAQPWMKKVTGGEKVAMGHFGSLGYIAAGFTGQLVGGGSKSTEEIKFPEGLKFLRDSMVATTCSMILIYLVVGILFWIGSPDNAYKAYGVTSGGVASYIMATFAQALQFGVGVAVILLGVRTMLAEIVPAFAGIAEKIVPNAMPALDCPVAFPYAPNAVLIGFLSSFVGGLVSLLVLALINPVLGLALILPGMVPHFFTGGTAGVFGNATGGRRGAVLGGFVNGVLITFLPALLLLVLGGLGFANTTFGDADFAWYGIVVGNVVKLGLVVSPSVGPYVGLVGLLIVVGVLIAIASWFQKKFVDSGWEPHHLGGEAPAAPPVAPAPKAG